MRFLLQVISYHHKSWVLFTDDNRVPIDLDLNQLGDGPHLFISPIVLYGNTKVLQAGVIGADTSHLIHTGALEVVELSIEGVVMWIDHQTPCMRKRL